MSEQVNYARKIENFNAATGNVDEDIAIRYLSNNDWDESRAASLYFNDHEHDVNPREREEPHRQRNVQNDPFSSVFDEFSLNRGANRGLGANRDNPLNSMISHMNDIMSNRMPQSSLIGRHFDNDDFFSTSRQDNPYNSPGHNFISSVSPRNVNRSSPAVSVKSDLLGVLPFAAKSTEDFFNTVKTKIGMLFIHESRHSATLQTEIDKLIDNPDLISILDFQYTTYAIDAKSKDAKNIIESLGRNRSLPLCLFLYNPFDLDRKDHKIIIDSLEGDNINYDNLSTAIYNNLTNKENYEKNLTSNVSGSRDASSSFKPRQQEIDYEDASQAEIIQHQMEEMRRLEQEEEDKRRKQKQEEELKLQKEKEQRELEEKQRLEAKRQEELIAQKKKRLPAEPEANNPDATHIVFRLPDGETRVERRFLKSNTVGDLYAFVETLENKTFNNFDLIQTFPMVVFSDKKKTLADEKLFPNALIQIREL